MSLALSFFKMLFEAYQSAYTLRPSFCCRLFKAKIRLQISSFYPKYIPQVVIVELYVRTQHSPCSFCRRELLHYLRVRTNRALPSLADAKMHHRIDRWVERTERWRYRSYGLTIEQQLQCLRQLGLHRVAVASMGLSFGCKFFTECKRKKPPNYLQLEGFQLYGANMCVGFLK